MDDSFRNRFHVKSKEDVLGVFYEHVLRAMLVSGAGEPTFDSRAPNPYETRKQRRGNEVRSLLDMRPAKTIVFDPSAVGVLRRILRRDSRS